MSASRPIDEALAEVLRTATSGALAAGVARFETHWVARDEDIELPWFELLPVASGAVSVGASAHAHPHYLHVSIARGSDDVYFEVWAPTVSEQLERVRAFVGGVVSGHCEALLRRSSGSSAPSYSLVVRFPDPAGNWVEYAWSPERANSFLELVGNQKALIRQSSGLGDSTHIHPSGASAAWASVHE